MKRLKVLGFVLAFLLVSSIVLASCGPATQTTTPSSTVTQTTVLSTPLATTTTAFAHKVEKTPRFLCFKKGLTNFWAFATVRSS
jgi:hypothetical protein